MKESLLEDIGKVVVHLSAKGHLRKVCGISRIYRAFLFFLSLPPFLISLLFSPSEDGSTCYFLIHSNYFTHDLVCYSVSENSCACNFCG